MDRVFPFGLPLPTAFYLSLYVLTFVLHHAVVQYVVAGSLYVSWSTLVRRRSLSEEGLERIAELLRDWLPFALSAAITAGVAPLLFMQIVYPRHFYTANLLLSWRWMVVVPVLIVAFYLLYVIKSSILARWSWISSALVVVATSACFLFVGFCWTANHLLANDAEQWPEVYASNVVPLPVSAVLLRTLVWVGGSFATMATAVAWQLRVAQQDGEAESAREVVRRLALVSVAGLLVAVVAGFTVSNVARSGNLKLQLLRSGLLLSTTTLFFLGLRTTPLATTATIMFLSPIIITALSASLLGEPVGPRCWAGVLLGFAGAIIVTRPGIDGAAPEPGMLFILAAAFTNALYQLSTRKLRVHDDPMTTLFYTAMVGAVLVSFAVPSVWQAPTPREWLILVSIGASGAIGHLCLIRAFHRRRHRGIVADVAEHRLDLSDHAIGAHEERLVRSAHRHPHTPARVGHPARDVAPQKARTAVDGHQFRHGVLPRIAVR